MDSEYGNLCSCRSNMLQTNKPKQNSDRPFVSSWLACSSHWMKKRTDWMTIFSTFSPIIPILEKKNHFHPHHFCMNYQLAWNHTKQSLFRDLLSLHESLFQQKNRADLLLYHSTLTFSGILFVIQAFCTVRPAWSVFFIIRSIITPFNVFNSSYITVLKEPNVGSQIN